MTAEELMTLNAMRKGTDMSSYEHFAIADKTSKRPSAVGIGGLVLGGAAFLTAAGAWIFAGVYSNAKSRGNERAIDILANQALQERNERVAQTSPSMVDVIRIFNNSQSGASSVSQAEALALLLQGGRGGQVCPQPVALYQPAMPCACPKSNN